MELLPKELETILPPLYSQDEVKDPMCVFKIFTPDAGWSWFIVEGSKQGDRDWLFFTMVISPIVPEGELGYVLLSDLQKVRGCLGLPVERDLWWEPRPLSQCKG
jgi:hypothetical protein